LIVRKMVIVRTIVQIKKKYLIVWIVIVIKEFETFNCIDWINFIK